MNLDHRTNPCHILGAVISTIIFVTGCSLMGLGFSFQRNLLIPASLLLPCGVAACVATYCKIRRTNNRINSENIQMNSITKSSLSLPFSDSRTTSEFFNSSHHFKLLAIDPLMRRPMTSLQYRSCSDTCPVNEMSNDEPREMEEENAIEKIEVPMVKRCSYEILTPNVIIVVGPSSDEEDESI